MPRKPDPRRIKIHRIYTPAEAAERLGMHTQSVLRWIKSGALDADRSKRPWLIEGAVLRAFLEARRTEGRCRLRPEQLYCLPCREPRVPDGRMADFRLATPVTGMLVGLCPGCGRLMHKRMRRADVEGVRAHLDVTIQKAQPRIVGGASPSVTVDSKKGDEDHGKAQLG